MNFRLPYGIALAVLCELLTCCSVYASTLLGLSAGIHRIQAEVVSTSDERTMGLMHRKSMPPHNGMLFVFPQAGEHCMWMRDTLIPLSVAFLDANGTILNIEDMEALTLASHCATGRAKFALEMNRGWFKSRGIAPGGKIDGIDKAPPAQ